MHLCAVIVKESQDAAPQYAMRGRLSRKVSVETLLTRWAFHDHGFHMAPGRASQRRH